MPHFPEWFVLICILLPKQVNGLRPPFCGKWWRKSWCMSAERILLPRMAESVICGTENHCLYLRKKV